MSFGAVGVRPVLLRPCRSVKRARQIVVTLRHLSQVGRGATDSVATLVVDGHALSDRSDEMFIHHTVKHVGLALNPHPSVPIHHALAGELPAVTNGYPLVEPSHLSKSWMP